MSDGVEYLLPFRSTECDAEKVEFDWEFNNCVSAEPEANSYFSRDGVVLLKKVSKTCNSRDMTETIPYLPLVGANVMIIAKFHFLDDEYAGQCSESLSLIATLRNY